MAPPVPSPDQPLTVRLSSLVQTLQFAWFCGHLTLLACTARYSLAILKFSSNYTSAVIAYRLAFIGAAVTYGIVVYKAYRARFRAGHMPTGQQGVMKILGDENVQYLLMALVWLYSKAVFFALFPFAVYSTFHFLTYMRTNVLPTILPAAPGNPPHAIGEAIGKFVKKNYDNSMHLVSMLEIFLWLRVFLYCLVFKNSWILLAIYTVFLRARYGQSVFVRESFRGLEMRGDAMCVDSRVPEGAKQAWNVLKMLVKRVGELTEFTKVSTASPTVKKET